MKKKVLGRHTTIIHNLFIFVLLIYLLLIIAVLKMTIKRKIKLFN